MSRRSALLERSPLPSLADARAAALGVDGVDGRPDDDLQQAVAVEARGERLTDPAQRALIRAALLAKLLQAAFELARHLVELLAELRELIAAAGGDLRREVARAQAPRGGEEVLDLAVQRARDDDRRDERQQEEAEQHEARDEAALLDVVLGVAVGSRIETRMRSPMKPGRRRRRCARGSSLPPIVDRPPGAAAARRRRAA